MTNPSTGTDSQLPQLARLREIVAILRAPGGCPWDREQTHASLRSAAIEEAHEVVEAIDSGNDPHLREELGDLLLQVLMHAQIAGEEGRFDLESIAAGVSEKLVRRHPHVFGQTKLDDSAAVLKQWEEIKRAEREEKGAPADASALDGVSKALPALMRAEKLQKRAARKGFDWRNAGEVVEKIREEILEVEEEMASRDRAKMEEELGDLLFSVVNLTRKCGFEAEMLLHQAGNKFARRFQAMETELAGRGETLGGQTLAELDAIWDEVKRREQVRT